MKKKDKIFRIKIVTTIISSILLFVSKININYFNVNFEKVKWENIKNVIINIPIREIIYDLSVGILSAMLLIWIIDEISERDRLNDEKKKLFVLFNKIIPPLKNYYDFYLKLYVATRSEKVNENDKVLQSLFNDKETFINQIKKSEPFYKDGCRVNRSQIQKFYEDKDKDKDIPLLPWYRCWTIDNEEFYRSITKIQEDYGYLFPIELLQIIETLIKRIGIINNLTSILEGTYLDELKIPKGEMREWTTDSLIEFSRFTDILNILEELMIYIQKESNRDILSIDIKNINQRTVSPSLGSTLGIKQ